MADLRIVDAPVLLQESITDDVKMPTGGLGNYAIRLGDLVWYVVAKENLASKSYVDTSSKGVQDKLDIHIANKNNPHQVTKEQVGLSNVDNTADIDKPVSNATKSAIITATTDMATKAYVNQKDNLKADKATTLSGYGITDAYTKTQIDSKTGDLTTLKTTDKTQLVKSINEVFDNTKGAVDLYNKNVLAGVGANGWADTLIALSNGRNQRQKNSDILSVKDFGAKGDGVTDDSDAFQAAANHGFVLVPKGDYLITKTINITAKTVFFGVGGVIKPNYTGGIFDTKNGATLIVDNLLIDGSLYPFQWNAPYGMYVFTADNAEYISITNCKLTNVYGSGVRINSKSVNIQGNILINVTGNNWTEDSNGAYDNYGDGIHVMGCNTALIVGNVVNNKLALQSDNYLGRCGIVTEFDAKNATILGNYVSGYDRGIHCETTYDNVIKNNNVENCGASLLLTHAWRSVVEGNTLIATRKFTVGTFINYGVLCLYVDNYNSVVRNNKIIIADNSGHTSDFRAVWFSGNTEIKDYIFDSNLIIGGITANGGSNVLFKNNTFKPCSLKRPIDFQGGFKFISNVFYGNLKLNSSVALSDMAIVGNDFYDINDTNSITVTNPFASGYKVNGNRFFIKEGATAKFVISAHMTGDTVGELSGNTIVLPSSADIVIRLLEYNTSSNLNKFYSVSPNLMLGGTKKVSVLFNSLSNDTASTFAYDPPNLAPSTQQSTNILMWGVKVGYIVSVSFDKNLQGTRMWGEVTSNDIVTIYHRNDTSTAVDLPSGTLTVKIV